MKLLFFLFKSICPFHIEFSLKDYDFEGTCYPREDMLETTSPGIHPIPVEYSDIILTKILFVFLKGILNQN